MRYRFYLFIAAWFAFANGLTAQTSFIVNHYTKQDYGGGHQNWCLDTDDQGFLYVANNNGLLVFDGSRWTRFADSSLYILRSVKVSRDGRIYTGSYEEFGYWQKDASRKLAYHSLKSFVKGYNFHNNEIWKIIEHENKIYFQSFSSLFVYDKRTVTSIKLPGNVLFLLKAGERLFIQVIGKGLFELVNDQFVNLDPDSVLAGTEVKTVLPFSDSSFLIGTTSDGLFLYSHRNIIPWNVPAGELLKQYQINNGLILDDRFVFGTIVGGVITVDHSGNVAGRFNFDNALQNNTVLAMCTDKSGSLWIGLDRGIDNISFHQPVTIYDENAGLVGTVYTAVMKDDRLYIGSNRGVFTYGRDAGGFHFEGMIPRSQGQVWQLKELDGRIYCGHTNGTYVIDGNNFIKVSDVTGGFDLMEIFRNHKRYLIQSTYSPLVLYEEAKTGWAFSRIIKGFIEPSRFLESDHQDNIWVSHAIKGLYKLKLDTGLRAITDQRRLGKKDGFPSDFNIKVFKVANRIVFTTGYKLFTWDDLNERIVPLDELNKALSGFEAAEAITYSGNDRYWFIKKNDIALFELKGYKPTMLYRLLLPLYNISMPDNYEYVVPLSDTLSLICLDNGFALVNTGNPSVHEAGDAKLIWSGCYSQNADDEVHLLDMDAGGSTVAFRNNTITFTFSLLNCPGIVKQFQYKLEGIDTDWSRWTNKAEVKYTRLPHGKYKFLVRSIDSSGKLTGALQYSIYVKRPWYISILAWIIYSILTILLIFCAFYLYRRRIVKHHEQLRNDELLKNEKARQLAEQEIITLHNRNLQAEVSHKNIQLADSTMSLIKKNELLISIKNELMEQKEQLGNRYPTRYFDKISKLIDRNISNDNDWKLFESLFDQAHENFFRRLKASYPDLTQSDLKLCAYLKLNLASKEIAPLLNISIRGVEIRRYRLRKRLGLTTDHNLVDFIMQI